MEMSSAPGKVYLFGEHAVVYDEPAIPCAIDRRMRVTIKKRDDSKIGIIFPKIGVNNTVEYGMYERASVAEQYVIAALRQACDAVGLDRIGFDVRIEGELPIAAGLGSSAAGTVAKIDAAVREIGGTINKEELADRAYQVEKTVQGSASRADTFCSAMGGAVRIEDDDCEQIETPELPFIIGYDGNQGETSELVSDVRTWHNRYPVIRSIIKNIGVLVKQGESMLKQEDLEHVGDLMDINHGLLASLGVSAQSLDNLVWVARDSGALGAKLTGAGGGGCVLALDSTGNTLDALRSSPHADSAFRAPMDFQGVRGE